MLIALKRCNMSIKQEIRLFVEDHFKQFGFYPEDVEVNGTVYDWCSYWWILDSEVAEG
jgi:hypothetical protein